MEQDKYVRWGKLTTVFLILASCFILLLFWIKLPPEVPLFYSRPWGEDQLGQPFFLWILPGGTILVFLGSFAIGKFLTSEKLLIHLITFGATLFSFLSFLTLFKIVTLAI
ncbi:MAG: hypothetical protein ACOZBZ_00635 [Patescibacteria group bacterium]